MKIKTPSFVLAVYAKGDPDADKLALVLPGRLDTKDYVHMTSLVDFLSGLGYYAVSFDPPASWESPGSPDNYTTTNYLKAVKELIKHFGQKPTLLAGHSRGGAVAALATAENECVTGVVLIMASHGEPSPVSAKEQEKGYHESTRDIPPGNIKTKGQKSFRLPLTYFEDGKKYNPSKTLQTFTKPKLLICGTYDNFFPPPKVKAVYEKLPSSIADFIVAMRSVSRSACAGFSASGVSLGSSDSCTKYRTSRSILSVPFTRARSKDMSFSLVKLRSVDSRPQLFRGGREFSQPT